MVPREYMYWKVLSFETSVELQGLIHFKMSLLLFEKIYFMTFVWTQAKFVTAYFPLGIHVHLSIQFFISFLDISVSVSPW